MEGMAYGAGKAGGAFNPITFFQQPHTILRILSWFFSIVIFGSIANEGYVNRPDEAQEFCIFNRNQNACNYGLFMGTLAFLCCLVFLALDVYFPQISSVKDRKKAVLADVGVSAFWSFMWFVGFCFLTNQWQVAKQEDNPLREGGDAARAAITFSFFSIFTWPPPPSSPSSLLFPSTSPPNLHTSTSLHLPHPHPNLLNPPNAPSSPHLSLISLHLTPNLHPSTSPPPSHFPSSHPQPTPLYLPTSFPLPFISPPTYTPLPPHLPPISLHLTPNLHHSTSPPPSHFPSSHPPTPTMPSHTTLFTHSLPPQGGPVLFRLSEVPAGGRLCSLLPGLHRPQPGCCGGRGPLHLLHGRGGRSGTRSPCGGVLLSGDERRGWWGVPGVLMEESGDERRMGE
ncbi:synaptogyrin-1 isoform X1 [Oncorhynchus mykiss]|uniref:synaptogyrin-1 isoform X1 n=1 Tax=Oncorhynchus mykiss TaxID=8022 RepID=UPI001877D620|nr:synaptogyrin-1 isoform X1 [Oncorhynchus mykiss]